MTTGDGEIHRVVFDSDGTGEAYVGYGDYGVYATANDAAGRFEPLVPGHRRNQRQAPAKRMGTGTAGCHTQFVAALQHLF